MAAAFSAAATGAGSVYYSFATDINRRPRSLAERLGEEGAARLKSCFRGALLDARPQNRCSEWSPMRIYFRRINGKGVTVP